MRECERDTVEAFGGRLEDKGDIFTDLVLALLAVNKWTLERVGSILPQLEEAGLTNPETVASLDFPTVFERVKEAGYQRGDYIISLIADRLLSAARTFRDKQLEKVIRDLEEKKVVANGLPDVPPEIRSTWKLVPLDVSD